MSEQRTRRGYNNGNIRKIRAMIIEHPGLTLREYAELAGIRPAQVHCNMAWMLSRGEVYRVPQKPEDEKGKGQTQANVMRQVRLYRYFPTSIEAVRKVDPSTLPRIDGHPLSHAWVMR